MSRQRAVQERIRRLDGLLKRSRKHQFACNAPALPACSLTGEESVTEAGVSFALCCSPVASGGKQCSSAFEVECLHEEASRTEQDAVHRVMEVRRRRLAALS